MSSLDSSLAAGLEKLIVYFLFGCFYLSASVRGPSLSVVAEMALVPAPAVRETWESVKDATRWAGVSADLWSSMASELGDAELSSLVLLAAVSDEDYRSAAVRITPPILHYRSHP